MNELRLKAFGKINLGLDVLRRREDGYHDVRMIMQNVRLYDGIILVKTENRDITMEANLKFLPLDGSNLMVKAAKLLFEEFNLPGGLHMKLDKRIPVAAGMAGGSTDAAAVLYGINRMYSLGLTLKELQAYGVKLGADVPFCLMRKAALSEGIGEILTPVPSCPECLVVLAKPAVSVSTKYVYEHLVLNEETIHPDIDGMLEALNNHDLHRVASLMGNVLETVTEKEYPQITKIKEIMKNDGALNALMSGSGPTVFGLFEDIETAGRCLDHLRAAECVSMARLTGLFM